MTDTPLTLLVPTRGRGASLRRCVTSAVANAGLPLRVIALFDDDPLGFAQAPDWPFAHKILATPRHYYVRALNRLADEARMLDPATDFFVVCNDDDEFVRPNWARDALGLLVEAFPATPERSEGEGILELFAPGVCAHYISRLSFFDRHFGGNLLDPAYTHFCADLELRERAQALGAYAYLDAAPRDAMIAHNVYGTRDRLAVECYEAWHASDQRTYKARRAALQTLVTSS